MLYVSVVSPTRLVVGGWWLVVHVFTGVLIIDIQVQYNTAQMYEFFSGNKNRRNVSEEKKTTRSELQLRSDRLNSDR